MNDKLLEVSAVAARLGITTHSVYRHRITAGSPLEFVRVGPKKGYRIKESSLVRLLDNDREDPA